MKVAIDTRPLQNLSASRGIGVYTSHLIKYLHKSGEVEVVELKSGKVPETVDLIHYPWFDLFFHTLPLRKDKPTVVTIHDVTPLVLPEFYPPGIKGRINFELQKLALRRTDAVMTDSEVSRRDMIKYLPVRSEKVHKVHLAPQDGLEIETGDDLLTMVKEKFKLPKEFVLYVGDVNRNKNLLSLVQACKQLEIGLVIVGKQAVNDGILKQVQDDGIIHPELQDLVRLLEEYGKDPQIMRLGFVETKDLAVIYRLASLFCLPSLYEGFGVSVLEAMKCGCPVLAAKRGSLPEIGGSAAIYVEPTVDRLMKGIKMILNLSPTQRKRLIQEGQKRAMLFSWKKTAKEVLEVYKEVLR